MYTKYIYIRFIDYIQCGKHLKKAQRSIHTYIIMSVYIYRIKLHQKNKTIKLEAKKYVSQSRSGGKKSILLGGRKYVSRCSLPMTRSKGLPRPPHRLMGCRGRPPEAVRALSQVVHYPPRNLQSNKSKTP